jgi:hypothetical protein
MKALLILLALLWFAVPAAAMERAQGFCENGAQVVVTASLNSTTTVQRSYPSCTISVYITGTVTLATIYSDNLGTALGNPFTAQSSGLWFFYAQDGIYDVTLSGAGLASPFTMGAVQLLSAPVGYTSLLEYGAICDGATNVQPAVTAALAKGVTHLFLPPNCLWNPTANTVPGGVDIYGGSLQTSKIWATNPTVNFLNLGPTTQLTHVNIQGKGCTFYEPILGCPIYLAVNNDLTSTVPNQSTPYTIGFDVGASASSGAVGLNGVTCIQHDSGGCIYAQLSPSSLGHGSGSAIQADQELTGTSGWGLLVTRGADGPGTLFWDLAGSEGTAHAPQSTVGFTSSTKGHGNYIDMFESTSTWDGAALSANFGSGGGTYNGNFIQLGVNSTNNRYAIDNVGDTYQSGIATVAGGASVASAGAITPTGQLFIVTGAASINTINLPATGGFFPPGGNLSSNAFCLTLIAATGSTWTLTTGGNIAVAAANPGTGHFIELCHESVSNLFYVK